MRIGILADIHEQLDPLRHALGMLQKSNIDRIVVLGDTFDGFGDLGNAATIVSLLEQAGVEGVWGNHDFGLCHQVMDQARELYPPEVFGFMKRMQPYLEIEDCHFSHGEPWLDPYEVMDLWHFDGYPDTVEKVQRSFHAVSHRYMFIGHFHRWIVMTPSSRIIWDGRQLLRLDDRTRYLVVISPVYDGHCAVFDTDTMELTPIKSGEN
jgi:hypothetical protein